MKKICLIVLLLSITYWCVAQKYTEIKGRVDMENMPEEVSLYEVRDGSNRIYATTKVTENGSYGFLFVPEYEGFYSVGDDRINHPVYIKGGETIHMNLLETKAELYGKNTKENIQLYRWEAFSYPIRLKSVYFMKTRSTYEDFFPELTEFVKKLPAFKAKVRSGNPEFDERLKQKMDYDLDYYALIYLKTPRARHPQKEELADYYKTIVSADKFMTDDVLNLPNGIFLMNLYAGYAAGKFDIDEYLKVLNNDRLKGECVLSYSHHYKSYDQYQDMMGKYGKYFTTASLKNRAEAIGSKLYQSVPGRAAADFSYPDVNGKMVALSDFKGKVVLVDVWATWCGPCRKEFPALKKLESEFQDKELVVIGVSVDESRDKKKWAECVRKEQLEGVQLFADGWSKVTKDYHIKSIPRFMVFDKKGNIVTVDAPRPSNPELKRILQAELAK